MMMWKIKFNKQDPVWLYLVESTNAINCYGYNPSSITRYRNVFKRAMHLYIVDMIYNNKIP